MAQTVKVHLMFDGVAEEAMNFYVSLFGGSKIVEVRALRSWRARGGRYCQNGDVHSLWARIHLHR